VGTLEQLTVFEPGVELLEAPTPRRPPWPRRRQTMQTEPERIVERSCVLLRWVVVPAPADIVNASPRC